MTKFAPAQSSPLEVQDDNRPCLRHAQGRKFRTCTRPYVWIEEEHLHRESYQKVRRVAQIQSWGFAQGIFIVANVESQKVGSGAGNSLSSEPGRQAIISFTAQDLVQLTAHNLRRCNVMPRLHRLIQIQLRKGAVYGAAQELLCQFCQNHQNFFD